MKYLFLILNSLISLTLCSQNNILYHQYEPSASDYNILRWNINSDSLSTYKWYIKETFDSSGKVIRLDFLENGQLEKRRLCYLPDFVVFTYPDNNTIIEELYNSDKSPMNGIECEVPYKRIYTIDNNYKITNLQIDYFIDSLSMKDIGMNLKDISVELDYINEVREQVSNGIYDLFNASWIRYYFKSFRKYNRKFPFMNNSNIEYLSRDNIEYKDAYNCMIK